MPLKASDIVKKLPEGGKKNCKECGFPTCFAFAMKVAGDSSLLSKCPYLTDEVRAELEDALAPPIRLVRIGKGDKAIAVGDEEVIYRHEKTFKNPPGIGVLLRDSEDDAEIERKIKALEELKFERVGYILKGDLFGVELTSWDRGEKVLDRVLGTDYPLVLISQDTDILLKAKEKCYDKNPLIYPITKENIDAVIPKIKDKPCPVGVKGKLEEIPELTERLKSEGIEDIMIDPSPQNLLDIVRDGILIRRASLKQSYRPLGYPIISLPCYMGDGLKEILLAGAFIIKYAGVVILSDIKKETLFPLLIRRFNIYTDPRRPLTVEEQIYEINEPDEESPVIVTTNFALTYYAVASEIESSRVPTYLCIKDTEGLCVLAAWTAGKFVGDLVGAYIKKCGIAEKVKNKKLIIPGLAARIKGELEDELPDWEVIVGPKEASEIPSFLPALVEKWKKQGG